MADQPQSLGDFEKLHNDDEEMVSYCSSIKTYQIEKKCKRRYAIHDYKVS